MANKGELQKISITCPDCGYNWYRKPSPAEVVVRSGAAGSIDLKTLLYIYNSRCAGCGKRFKDINEATIDHIEPKSAGGINHITNYQLMHAECNLKKGGVPRKPGRPKHTNKIKIPVDFLAQIAPPTKDKKAKEDIR